MTEEKKTDYLELAKDVYNSKKGAHNPHTLATIAIAEELRRLNENMETGLFRIDKKAFDGLTKDMSMGHK